MSSFIVAARIREMLRKWLFPLFFTFLVLVSCSDEPYAEYELMMDTQCSITVYETSDRQYIEPVFASLRAFEEKVDRFREGSDIWRINECAGLCPVEVDSEVFDLISMAKDFSLATGGAFNPLLGAISDLWGFDRIEHESLPDEGEIAKLLEATIIDNLVLDEEKMTVFLADSRCRLDLGAIAKGYASQKAADLLSSYGVDRAIVNLGGNVYTVGEKERGRAWTVGIQNPNAETGGYFTTVESSDSAVVTSGAYQRNFSFEGKTYHHILDPATGWSAESDITSVTVISPDGAQADAFSTACFVLGSEEALELCASYGLGCLVLTSEGEVLRLGC